MVKKTILFNKIALNYFTYNFFVGLQFNKKINLNHNLGLAIKDLIENQNKLYEIQNFQKLISERNIVTRAFYWIFNIKNYRLNFYKLAALETYNNYLKFIKKNNLPEETQEPIYIIKKYSEVSLYQKIKDIFLNLLLKSGIPYQEIYDENEEANNKEILHEEYTTNLIPYFLKSKIKTNENLNDNVRVIDTSIQFYLIFLQINKDYGDTISFNEINASYRKAARLFHPDKVGSIEEFVLLTEVMEEINFLFSNDAEIDIFYENTELKDKLINYELNKYKKILAEAASEIKNEIKMEYTNLFEEEVLKIKKVVQYNLQRNQIKNVSIPSSIFSPKKLEVIKYTGDQYSYNSLFIKNNRESSQQLEISEETQKPII